MANNIHREQGYEACVQSLIRNNGRTALKELVASIPAEIKRDPSSPIIDPVTSQARLEFIAGWKEAWGVGN
jgi:hypothetical protein